MSNERRENRTKMRRIKKYNFFRNSIVSHTYMVSSAPLKNVQTNELENDVFIVGFKLLAIYKRERESEKKNENYSIRACITRITVSSFCTLCLQQIL